MPAITKLLDLLQTRGREKGLLGRSGRWLAVWVVVAGVRWINRALSPEPVVIKEKLEPGERLLITHYGDDVELRTVPSPSRRRRRRHRDDPTDGGTTQP